MNRFIFRVLDLLGAAVELPFKIADLLFLPLVGLLVILGSVAMIMLGASLWGCLLAIAVGLSFIVSPWALRKRR